MAGMQGAVWTYAARFIATTTSGVGAPPSGKWKLATLRVFRTDIPYAS